MVLIASADALVKTLRRFRSRVKNPLILLFIIIYFIFLKTSWMFDDVEA